MCADFECEQLAEFGNVIYKLDKNIISGNV